jgi:hypothetical protein
MQQLQAQPNSVFLQPEFVTTAVSIALGAGGLMALQSGGAGSNTALLTFNTAHGYTQTLLANGTTLIQNTTTGHGPPPAGGTTLDTTAYTCFQLTGATGNTAVNGFTMSILAIPSTTTMLVACPVTGANPTVTAATFIPVFILQYGQYNTSLGANVQVQYNPDNTGAPYTQNSLASSVVPAPTFRTLQAASTNAQIEVEGLAGQTIVSCIAPAAAGTSRWSLYFR